MEGIVVLIIFVLIILSNFIKFVPPNTVIIVDRNTHYLKTKKRGPYIFIPSTDKITTQISTNKIYKSYTNNYETHDGKIVRLAFSATYHSENLDSTLNALASARRSIDDIVCSSVYWAVNNLNFTEVIIRKELLYNEAYQKLLPEALELNIVIDNFEIQSVIDASFVSDIETFKPHLNSYSSGPIKF